MVSVKYHLNPETGEVNICSASKRLCKYGDINHFNSPYQAERSFENIMSKKLGKPMRNLPPIIVQRNTMSLPSSWDISNIYNSITFDSFGDVIGLDMIKAVEEYTCCTYDKWSDSFSRCVSSNFDNWNSSGNWSISDDFLDDGMVIPPIDFEEKLLNAYYSSNNADDVLGVLQHVREKGFDTSGLTPVEAIKKMLREENAKYVAVVEKMNSVDKRKLGLNEFSRSENHLSRIDASEPTAVSTDSVILGVVRLDDRGYHLVDGHHRVKWCINNNIKNGYFFVLS